MLALELHEMAAWLALELHEMAAWLALELRKMSYAWQRQLKNTDSRKEL